MTHVRFPLAALTALAAALPLSAQGDQAQKHLLRYTFQKGAGSHYAMDQHATMEMNMGERAMSTKMNIKVTLEFRITDVTDGVAEVESTIHRIQAKMDNPMTGAIDLDTDDEDSVPTMFDNFLDIVGQSMKLQIDDRGRTQNVEIPEVLKQAATARAGIDFEQMLGQFMAELPEQPVAVGETWETTMSQKLGQLGEMAIQVTNRLAAVQGRQATIDMTMKMDLPDESMPMKVELDDTTGTMVLNLDQGLPEKATMKMQMTMQAERGGMNMKMGMDLDLGRVAAPAKKSKDDKD